jgi:hypothetical protein
MGHVEVETLGGAPGEDPEVRGWVSYPGPGP